MKPLKERFNLKYLRNKQKLEYQENNFRECFFKVNFYDIPVRERLIVYDSYIIISSKAKVDRPTTVPILLEDGVFKAQFELEGYSLFEDGHNILEIKPETFNLFYIPKVNGKLTYLRDRTCIDIMFDKEWFEETMSKILPLEFPFLTALKKGRSCKLFEEAKVISTPIKQLLESMLNCSLPTSMRNYYYSLKIEELLLTIFSMHTKFLEDDRSNTNLSLDEKVIEVKEWVDKQEIGNIRLQEVEDIFHITQKNLNKGFQKYFGCNLSQYLREKQMEKARYLIKHKNYSINEVAKLLRYSYPQHFTSAFTKHFGYSPKELKAQKKVEKIRDK